MTTETTCPLALPLRRHIEKHGTTVTIVDANDETVALLEHQISDGRNAAEIVRRVNLHDDLVEALRESTDLVPRISGDDPMAPALADWLRNVRAVLAKVEGR